jgi:hypothetical protein
MLYCFKASLIYRILPESTKITSKLIHATIHFTVCVGIGVGLFAATKMHTDGNHFYTLHGWIGIATIGAYYAQVKYLNIYIYSCPRLLFHGRHYWVNSRNHWIICPNPSSSFCSDSSRTSFKLLQKKCVSSQCLTTVGSAQLFLYLLLGLHSREQWNIFYQLRG